MKHGKRYSVSGTNRLRSIHLKQYSSCKPQSQRVTISNFAPRGGTDHEQRAPQVPWHLPHPATTTQLDPLLSGGLAGRGPTWLSQAAGCCAREPLTNRCHAEIDLIAPVSFTHTHGRCRWCWGRHRGRIDHFDFTLDTHQHRPRPPTQGRWRGPEHRFVAPRTPPAISQVGP